MRFQPNGEEEERGGYFLYHRLTDRQENAKWAPIHCTPANPVNKKEGGPRKGKEGDREKNSSSTTAPEMQEPLKRGNL